MRVILKKGQCVSTLKGLTKEKYIEIIFARLQKVNIENKDMTISPSGILNIGGKVNTNKYLLDNNYISKYEYKLLEDDKLLESAGYGNTTVYFMKKR